MNTAENLPDDYRHPATSKGTGSTSANSEATMQMHDPLAGARDAAAEVVQRGTHLLKQGSDKVKYMAKQTAEQTAKYVQDQPLKSLLLAVAAGAVIALLLGAATRHSRYR